MATRIAWTQSTWNPVSGCTKVSPGCQHCYAERRAKRLAGRFGYPADEPFRVTLHEDTLGEPLRWQKPRMVFVCSMGDLFHNDVAWAWQRRVFGIMHTANRHTFQVLTKRPLLMAGFIDRYARWCGFDAWPREYGHVWLGVSAEDQQRADGRIPILLRIPAAVRFASFEPLLGPVDIEEAQLTGRFLDWVIVGCESGPGRRRCDTRWVADLYEQGRAAGVPIFVKQIDVDGEVVHDAGRIAAELSGYVCTGLDVRDIRQWPKRATSDERRETT